MRRGRGSQNHLAKAQGWVPVLALAGCFMAATGPALADEARRGYVEPSVLAGIADNFPSAPVAGSPQDQADKTTSARYRSLEGSERWLLATTQAELRPPMGLSLFDCTLGNRVDAAKAPTLTRLYSRLLHDADGLAEQIKAKNPRPRPVGDDLERPACQRLTEAGRKSNSYPSGSAALAVAYGEALSQLVPDKAEAVRETARQIALSRVICGMHYPHDVEVGQAVGKRAFDLAAATPEYAADLVTARAELAAARQAGETSPACAAERSALAQPLPQTSP